MVRPLEKISGFKSPNASQRQDVCIFTFLLKYIFCFRYVLVQHGPGVDSASNRNQYQEYSLEVKAAGA